MSKFGLFADSELFNPNNYPKEGHVLLGYSISIHDLNLTLVYEKCATGKCVFIKAKTKKNPIKLITFEKQLISHGNLEISSMDMNETTDVFFQKKAIVPIIQSFSQLIFTSCTIKLDYSVISKKSNKQYKSLKCQGWTPNDLKIANMPDEGSGGGGENGGNTAVGQPTPPEHR
jgi:hypothetical protein